MNFIKHVQVHIVFILCIIFSVSSAIERFEIEILDSSLMNNETRICLYDDAQEIGFISYMKVPFFNRYIMHTLFVYPDMRNKGYGTKLLSYTCDRLENIGAGIIYVQPGPFDIIDGRFQDVQVSRETKIKQLVALYGKCGFVPVNKITQACAYIIYTCMGIDEDSKYLLYKG